MGSSTVRRWCLGMLAAGLGTLAIGFGGTSTALAADCGNLKPAAKDIRAKNVGCKKAKAVVEAWVFGIDKGWECEGHPKVVCRKGDAVVKFTAQ